MQVLLTLHFMCGKVCFCWWIHWDCNTVHFMYPDLLRWINYSYIVIFSVHYFLTDILQSLCFWNVGLVVFPPESVVLKWTRLSKGMCQIAVCHGSSWTPAVIWMAQNLALACACPQTLINKKKIIISRYKLFSLWKQTT